jgi:hypothetical protein
MRQLFRLPSILGLHSRQARIVADNGHLVLHTKKWTRITKLYAFRPPFRVTIQHFRKSLRILLKLFISLGWNRFRVSEKKAIHFPFRRLHPSILFLSATGWMIKIYQNCSYSSVNVVMGYELDDQGSVPGRARNFCVLHSVQTGSGAHPVSYTLGTRGSFAGGGG